MIKIMIRTINQAINQVVKQLIKQLTNPAIKLQASQRNEGGILGALNIINSNEIKAADLALNRTSNPAVRRFAETMRTDHARSFQETKALVEQSNIRITRSPKLDSLDRKGKEDFKKLESTSGKSFDREYVRLMVKGHREALRIIDNDLLPKATNPKVTAYLKTIRRVVNQHLQMAESLERAVGR